MSAWETLGRSDEWYTPPEVFVALGCSFDLDVAAPTKPTHVPTRQWFTQMDDGLRCNWRGFVWMNPPFGGRQDKEPWLRRFFDHGNGIALTPDRTSAPWFQYAWSRAELVLFVCDKIKFITPDGERGKQPGNGTALWSAGEQGRQALERAAASGFGILASPVQRMAA